MGEVWRGTRKTRTKGLEEEEDDVEELEEGAWNIATAIFRDFSSCNLQSSLRSGAPRHDFLKQDRRGTLMRRPEGEKKLEDDSEEPNSQWKHVDRNSSTSSQFLNQNTEQ